jgi:ABC-type multidrug transport system ATPase subunit
MSLVVFTLQLLPQTQRVGDILRWVFCAIPSFCVTHGLVFSSTGKVLVDTRKSSPGTGRPEIPEDVWAWFNLKGDAAALVAHFVVGLVVIFLIECDLFSCCAKLTCRAVPPENEDLELDDDVVAEIDRVANQGYDRGAGDQEELLATAGSPNRQDVIRVDGFRKAYTSLCGSPVLAVEKISFGLDYGECFALLGVNGAGKSTTFKALTNDAAPTTGTITISGYNVQQEFSDVRKLIGYCPQYDALFHDLTVIEHLWFYCKLKGVPAGKRSATVERSIKELNLKDHRNKLAGTLSGGNKRKLGVAIALLGNPPIILLDEPSAGMDPEARRFMWSVVEKISQRDKKSAVILTTHSMEEAEALSTKMGIMVRGGIMRCMGSC